MKDLARFLVEAKRRTYADGAAALAAAARAGSRDYEYRNGDYLYHDTFFGGVKFLGEEVVYRAGVPCWGMNYYGVTLDETLSEAVMDSILRPALLHVGEDPAVLPLRGPGEFSCGEYTYRFACRGDLACFTGEETILRRGEKIYQLQCSGGLLA